MAFTLTDRTQIAVKKTLKQPQIVLCIDGVETCYGSSTILEIERIGDSYLFIGSSYIGAYHAIDGQKPYISFEGSSQSIKQQLDIDKARGSSISSMQIALIDKNNHVTKLVTPGLVVDDILGRNAEVYLGFTGETQVSFPDDYVKIFLGVIEDYKAEPGLIVLTISHPDQKKRQAMFLPKEAKIPGSINASQTTITLDTTTDFILPVLGPNGLYDSAFESYVIIEEEAIKFTGVSGNDITGCTRATLGTFPNPHPADSDVKTMYRLRGNAMELSLKFMLSGWQGNFVSGLDIVSNFIRVDDGPQDIANAIYFSSIDIEDKYGLTVGDYVTTTGASNGANNFTLRQITAIQDTDLGSYIVVDGATLVTEIGSAALISFRSQYDTLPNGLRMSPFEVDVLEHLRLRQLFLSSFSYDFYIKDGIENFKDFLEQELYKPATCFSIPRKGKSSLGIHSAPIPSAETTKIDKTNIVEPSKMAVKRSINKNFANTIIYKFDDDVIDDKFLKGKITISGPSLSQIPIGTRAMVIESKGMRESLSGSSFATSFSNRRLNRYKIGAQYIEGVKVLMGDGFNIEIGDILLFDPTDLKVINTTDGNRDKEPTLFEVVNKDFNIKTGEVKLDIIDTNFNGQARYGLIGPSSRVSSGISTTQFVIDQAFTSVFGTNEYLKWSRYNLPAVKVRSSDFTTRFGQTVIVGNSGNTITVSPALSFTPQTGDVMELADYDYTSVTDEIKLLYAHMKNTAFADGKSQYNML